MKNFVIALLVALCVVLALRGCGGGADRVVERRDTVFAVRIDTVRQVDVQYRDRVEVRVDTLVHRVNDTTVIAVPIPIDRYLFTDDTTYRAQISGYNVTLDSMSVFRRSVDRVVTIDRTITPRPKRFGIGIGVGYGITLAPTGRPVTAPYIGIGISYNFIRF